MVQYFFELAARPCCALALRTSFTRSWFWRNLEAARKDGNREQRVVSLHLVISSAFDAMTICDSTAFTCSLVTPTCRRCPRRFADINQSTANPMLTFVMLKMARAVCKVKSVSPKQDVGVSRSVLISLSNRALEHAWNLCCRRLELRCHYDPLAQVSASLIKLQN